MERKLRKAEFGFDDYLEQMQQIKKMGGLSDLLGMIPGMGAQMKNIDEVVDAIYQIYARV